MLKNELFDLISDTLEIPRDLINEQSQLFTLCILSHYLYTLKPQERNNININKNGLEHDCTNQITINKGVVFENISFLINTNDESIPYVMDVKGNDGFTSIDLNHALLIFKLEEYYKLDIDNKTLPLLKTCGCVKEFIEKYRESFNLMNKTKKQLWIK